MKLTLGELRAFVREAKIGASPEYMKKERVREELQALMIQRVAAGDIHNDDELQQFVADAQMSLKTLKMIPFDVWKKMAKSTKNLG